MRRISILFVLLAFGLVPALSMAADSTAVAPVKAPRAAAQAKAPRAPAVAASGLYVSFFGSWNAYGMSGVNDRIGEYNLELAGRASVPKITSDYGLGVNLGSDRRRMALGLGYERFFASSDLTYGGTWGAVRFKLPGNAWYAYSELRLKSSGTMRTRLGLGAGVVTLAPVTQFALKQGSRYYAVPMTGAGPLGQAWLTEEWMGPGFDLFASGGYRYAKVENPKVTDTANLRGFPSFPIDYSGASVRAGVKVHLRK